MAAHHFFAGLGAGIAMLSLPMLVSGGGPLGIVSSIGQWIEGPPSTTTQQAPVADALRPRHGFLPGDPTPAPTELPLPTLQPVTLPTPHPTEAPAPVPPPATTSGVRTGVVHSGGAGVYVRRAAGIASPGDPFLPEGSPVIASSGATIRVGADEWQSIRALHNVVGWVPRIWLLMDGDQPAAPAPGAGQVQTVPRTPATQVPGLASEPPIAVAGAQATAPAAAATPTGLSRARVVNTDGQGVVLRGSPNLNDRRPTGYMEGTIVTVLERAGADWAHVTDGRGREGWVPSQYLAPVS